MSSSNCAVALVAVAVALVVAAPAAAAEDLATLQVQGLRGQSADLARRDRYECHNWAVDQSGETPVAAAVNAQAASAAKSNHRAETIDRIISGAAIGAGLGGLVSTTQHEDPGQGMLQGAAVGAVIGVATAGSGHKRDEAAAPEGPSDYLRALTACLEGRGYSVALPPTAEITASR